MGGNVNGIDHEKGLIEIKLLGVDYDSMNPEDIDVMGLMTGEIVEGQYKPSSDIVIHMKL